MAHKQPIYESKLKVELRTLVVPVTAFEIAKVHASWPEALFF